MYLSEKLMNAIFCLIEQKNNDRLCQKDYAVRFLYSDWTVKVFKANSKEYLQSIKSDTGKQESPIHTLKMNLQSIIDTFLYFDAEQIEIDIPSFDFYIKDYDSLLFYECILGNGCRLVDEQIEDCFKKLEKYAQYEYGVDD